MSIFSLRYNKLSLVSKVICVIVAAFSILSFSHTTVAFIGSKTSVSASDIIWDRIRSNAHLHWEIEEHHLQEQLDWHKRNKSHVYKVSQRSERYIHYITEQLTQRKLPLELALLPMVESAFDPFAVSHANAAGLWQFTPPAAIDYRLHKDEWYDGRRDVLDSTRAALDYLENLYKSFNNDWLLALAAYNAGPGTVRKAIRTNQALGRPTDFWSLNSLPRETRNYVPKLFALAKLLEAPEQYGVTWYPVKDSAYFAVVDTPSQMDLGKAATLATIDMGELSRLNPGFSQKVTAPNGPHRLLVPVERAHHFTNRLAKASGADTHRGSNASSQHAQYAANSSSQSPSAQQVAHQVKQGDSLWSIARYYDVTVSKLASWNGLNKKDTLHPGQQLSLWVDNSSTVVASGKSW